LKHKDSPHPYLHRMAQRWGRELRVAYPAFLAGRLFGPNRAVRRWIADLERRCHAAAGAPTLAQRLLAPVGVLAASWTWLTLRIDALQHPRLTRHAYRLAEEDHGLSRVWGMLRADAAPADLAVTVELQHSRRQAWVRLEGMLTHAHALGLGARLKDSLAASRNRLVLDLKRLKIQEEGALRALATKLEVHRARVRLVLPRLKPLHHELLLVARLFQHYSDRI
ncbi:MAG: hypothetical protein AAB368_17645, partial [bacterium]